MLMICLSWFKPTICWLYAVECFNTFNYIEIWWWCLSDLRYEYESMIWSMFWWSFMCFKWRVRKYGLKYVLIMFKWFKVMSTKWWMFWWVLKYDENKMWFMWFLLLKCLWSITEVCVGSMNTKVNVYEFEYDSMHCERPLGLYPHWHCIVKDHWAGIPFGIALRKTTKLASPLALYCERPLGRDHLWYCVLKDHWACIPYDAVLCNMSIHDVLCDILSCFHD